MANEAFSSAEQQWPKKKLFDESTAGPDNGLGKYPANPVLLQYLSSDLRDLLSISTTYTYSDVEKVTLECVLHHEFLQCFLYIQSNVTA